MLSSFDEIKNELAHCQRCPRLVMYRESVPQKAPYLSEQYWRKPACGFGDIRSSLLLLGPAPAAHGGNRTGRLFTGDGTSRFLMKVLHKKGFASQPFSESLEDGLLLRGCYITSTVKCAPPKDRPTPEEFRACSRYWRSEMKLLKDLKAILVFGKRAFDILMAYAKEKGCSTRGLHFRHGEPYFFPNFPAVYPCYHPSPRNTNTRRLTEEMLGDLLDLMRRS